MKSKISRLLCLLFSFIMCVTALVGCVKDEDEDKGSGKVTGSGETKFDNVDFGGKTIKISMPKGKDGSTTIARFMTGTEGDNTDVIVEEVNKRNENVCKKLNLKIKYSYVTDDWQTIVEDLESTYRAQNDSTPDAVVQQDYGLIRIMMKGLLMNCNTEEYTNYFDFSDDCWYDATMDAFSLGQSMTDGKQYIIASDYFVDILRCTDVIFVNENALKDISLIGGDPQAFYSLVSSGEWTWDYLMNLVNSYSMDLDGIAGIGENDKIGLLMIGQQSTGVDGSIGQPMGVTASADINFYEKVGGKYQLNTSTAITKFHGYIDKIMAVNSLPGTYAHAVSELETETMKVFTKGNTLFYLGSELNALENSLFSAIPISPLIFPKYQESDNYKAFVHDSAKMGGIFNSTTVFKEASAYFQLSSLRSDVTLKKYFEEGLKLKYETGDNTSDMLDLIYNNITVDTSFVWDLYACGNKSGEGRQGYWSILAECTAKNTNTLSNWWETQKNYKAQDFAEILKTFEGLK